MDASLVLFWLLVWSHTPRFFHTRWAYQNRCPPVGSLSVKPWSPSSAAFAKHRPLPGLVQFPSLLLNSFFPTGVPFRSVPPLVVPLGENDFF